MSTPTTTPTAWAHLPNAKHIDRVLADVKAHLWVWGAAWDEAYDAAYDAAYAAARDAARGAARDAARGAARDAARGAAWTAARGACAALIAWDDSADLLDMPVDAVRLLAASGHHPAVLMLSACVALSTVRS